MRVKYGIHEDIGINIETKPTIIRKDKRVEYMPANNPKKEYTLQVEQNGGEYYGFVRVVSKEPITIKDYKNVILGDTELKFDEVVTLISVKDVEEV